MTEQFTSQQMSNQMNSHTNEQESGDSVLIKIHRVKNLLPETGFDGLTELLGLLEATQLEYAKNDQPNLADSDQKTLILDEILELAEQHLNQPLGDDFIDDLLFGVAEFCPAHYLTEEDSATLRELLSSDCLQQESSPQNQTNSKDNTNPSIPYNLYQFNHYVDQLNQYSQIAESKHLNGLLDILITLNEWFVCQFNQETNNAENTFKPEEITALDLISNSVVAYFAFNDVDISVQQLFKGIELLSGSSIIPAEDIEEFSQVLIDEINLQADQEQLAEANSASEQMDANLGNNPDEPHTTIPEHLIEFLNLLQLSSNEVSTSLNDMLSCLVSDSSSQQQQETAIDHFHNELNKFSGVAGIAGFDGLQQSCEHIQVNFDALKKAKFNLSEQDCQIWQDWSEAVNFYLQSPLDQDRIQHLLVTHCTSGWLSSLDEGKTADLLVSLRELGISNKESEVPERQVEATEEDVSLAIPEDVFPELLDGLLQELPVLTEEFSQAVQYLSRGGRKNDVTTAQRIAHTIKGAGNTVGIKGIANLTHHLEDILTALANADTLPGKRISNTLLRGSDCLEEMSESLTSNGSGPTDAKDVLQEILDLASLIDRDGVQVDEQSSVQTPGAKTLDAEPASTKQTEPAEESVEQSLRVPVNKLDHLMQFSDEVMIINAQLRERLRQVETKTRAMQSQLDLIFGLGMELQELVDIRNYDLMKGINHSTAGSEFDALEMDQYNELHTCSRRIHEVATDIREIGASYRKELIDIDNMIIEQGHLNSEAQGDLQSMRRVPVKSVLPRIQRSVRQTCRLTGKNVDLNINGENLQMDRDILNGIIDPLMHVLRNAIDHGIENTEQRIAIGKSATGMIDLSFRQLGNMVEVICRDDGAGLNLDSIRAKAIERQIINADTDITEDELKQLIFQPNFSTSSQVTQVSGRGVGMDAVSTGIRALGGVLHLDSQPGQGCQLKITLPMSLVHSHCLLIKIGNQRIALAERSIKQILHPGAGTLEFNNEQVNFIFENQTYPVKTLDSLLTRVTPDNSIPLEKRVIVLVQHQNTEYAILIERIEGVTELVVKNIGGFIPVIQGVIGASILDDGSIAPVLDVQELLEDSKHWSHVDMNQIGTDQSDTQTNILVVDDSLSARRSLEQFVSDLGFNVSAARDGQEAIEQIYQKVPDMVITDMEMPRINGIELAEFIRSNPETAKLNIPIIMITSRSTAKHKQLAHSKGIDVYLTKPYSEQELTDHITTLFNFPSQPQVAISA